MTSKCICYLGVVISNSKSFTTTFKLTDSGKTCIVPAGKTLDVLHSHHYHIQ